MSDDKPRTEYDRPAALRAMAALRSQLHGASLLQLFRRGAGKLFTPLCARIAFALMFAGFAAVAYVSPGYDWDALAYIAIVVEQNFKSPEALHAFVYADVKRAISPAGWQQLVHFDAWRHSQFTSAENFASMLGFYRVKLAFIIVLGTVGKLTGVVYAPWVVGTFFALALFALFYLFLVKLALERIFALTIPVLLASGLPWLTRLPTPDSMSCFFVLLGFYLFAFAKRRSWSRLGAYGVWAIAVLTRPDNLVLMPALVIVQLLRRDMKLWEVGGVLLSVAGYFIATQESGHMGWWIHFYFTNVEYSQNMTSFDVPFSISLYLGAVLNGIVQMIYKAGWFHAYLALLMIYALAVLARPPLGGASRKAADGASTERKLGSDPFSKAFSHSGPGLWGGLMGVTVLVILARLVVFPFMSDRLLCPMVLIALLATLVALRDLLPVTDTKGNKSDRAADLSPID